MCFMKMQASFGKKKISAGVSEATDMIEVEVSDDHISHIFWSEIEF